MSPGRATGAASCATAGSAATTTAPCPPAGCRGPAETESRESSQHIQDKRLDTLTNELLDKILL